MLPPTSQPASSVLAVFTMMSNWLSIYFMNLSIALISQESLMEVKSLGVKIRETWVQTLPLLPSCVTLGKSRCLSEPLSFFIWTMD